VFIGRESSPKRTVPVLLQIAVAVVGSGLAIGCLLHLSYLHATTQVLSTSGHGPLIKGLQ